MSGARFIRDIDDTLRNKSECRQKGIVTFKLVNGETVHCTPAYYEAYVAAGRPENLGWKTLMTLRSQTATTTEKQIASDVTNAVAAVRANDGNPVPSDDSSVPFLHDEGK